MGSTSSVILDNSDRHADAVVLLYNQQYYFQIIENNDDR